MPFLCCRNWETIDWWGIGSKFTVRSFLSIFPPRCFSFCLFYFGNYLNKLLSEQRNKLSLVSLRFFFSSLSPLYDLSFIFCHIICRVRQWGARQNWVAALAFLPQLGVLSWISVLYPTSSSNIYIYIYVFLEHNFHPEDPSPSKWI